MNIVLILLIAGLFPDLTIAVPSPPQCRPGAVSGTRCYVECGIDRPGGDLRNFQASSFSACVNACNNDRNCVSAQFQRNSYFCYLKNRLKSARRDSGVDGIVCRGGLTTTTTRRTSTTTKPATTTPTVPVRTFFKLGARDSTGNALLYPIETTFSDNDRLIILQGSILAGQNGPEFGAEFEYDAARFRITDLPIISIPVNANEPFYLIDTSQYPDPGNGGLGFVLDGSGNRVLVVLATVGSLTYMNPWAICPVPMKDPASMIYYIFYVPNSLPADCIRVSLRREFDRTLSF